MIIPDKQWQRGDPSWLKRDANGRFASNGSSGQSKYKFASRSTKTTNIRNENQAAQTNTQNYRSWTEANPAYSPGANKNRVFQAAYLDMKSQQAEERLVIANRRDAALGRASNLREQADSAQRAFETKWAQGSDHDLALAAERKAQLGRGIGMLERTKKEEQANIDTLRERQHAAENEAAELENELSSDKTLVDTELIPGLSASAVVDYPQWQLGRKFAAAELSLQQQGEESRRQYGQNIADSKARMMGQAQQEARERHELVTKIRAGDLQTIVNTFAKPVLEEATKQINDVVSNVARTISDTYNKAAYSIANAVMSGLRWINSIFGGKR